MIETMASHEVPFGELEVDLALGEVVADVADVDEVEKVVTRWTHLGEPRVSPRRKPGDPRTDAPGLSPRAHNDDVPVEQEGALSPRVVSKRASSKKARGWNTLAPAYDAEARKVDQERLERRRQYEMARRQKWEKARVKRQNQQLLASYREHLAHPAPLPSSRPEDDIGTCTDTATHDEGGHGRSSNDDSLLASVPGTRGVDAVVSSTAETPRFPGDKKASGYDTGTTHGAGSRHEGAHSDVRKPGSQAASSPRRQGDGGRGRRGAPAYGRADDLDDSGIAELTRAHPEGAMRASAAFDPRMLVADDTAGAGAAPQVLQVARGAGAGRRGVDRGPQADPAGPRRRAARAGAAADVTPRGVRGSQDGGVVRGKVQDAPQRQAAPRRGREEREKQAGGRGGAAAAQKAPAAPEPARRGRRAEAPAQQQQQQRAGARGGRRKAGAPAMSAQEQQHMMMMQHQMMMQQVMMQQMAMQWGWSPRGQAKLNGSMPGAPGAPRRASHPPNMMMSVPPPAGMLPAMVPPPGAGGEGGRRRKGQVGHMGAMGPMAGYANPMPAMMPFPAANAKAHKLQPIW
ncbi:unnamed protein product [Pedinophyceae sp. YPF-701]|nr:unnamed protein product [Pedinophyceae sp. YPF-701]